MKKIILLILALSLGGSYALAQISNVEEKFRLPKVLRESSGIIFFNDKLVSHNDSGNKNKLYELDTISGTVTRTITITNASNVDWEDIAQDDTHIYVGDIGNNSGKRTDLKIYKIAKSAYLSATEITAEAINYSYSDQKSFTSNFNNTEWDAEALISFDENHLILFTKNWVNGKTKAYPIPKNSGTHTVSPLASTLNSEGLITGATYNPYTEKVYLIGYSSLLQPFVWESANFTGKDIFSGTNTMTSLASLGFEQTEGITHVGANRYFITSEAIRIPFISDYAKLVSFTTNDKNLFSIINQGSDKVAIYPNPVGDVLYLNEPGFSSFKIYDATSKLVYQGDKQKIDVSKLSSGFYFLKIYLKDHSFVIKKIVKN